MQTFLNNISVKSLRDYRRVTVAISLAALIVAGCSGDDSSSNPVPVDPAGSGSQTLLVVAEVSGSDGGGGLFSTNFTATVTDVGALPVTGAAVVIQGPFGLVTLVEQGAGVYAAVRNDYTPGTYVLSVVRSTDQVTGVRVIAPDIHSITSPTTTAAVTANQPFDVVWTRTVAAQECWMETRDWQSLPQMDTGLITVPGSDNPPNNDQRIRLFRKNTQAPAGGLQGSEFNGRIRNSVEPIDVQ